MENDEYYTKDILINIYRVNTVKDFLAYCIKDLESSLKDNNITLSDFLANMSVEDLETLNKM